MELINTEKDPWIKHLDTQWDTSFEQHESSTEDNLIQVYLGDQANPMSIFIIKTLSLNEKEDLTTLVKEYIDVFAWSYDDMPGVNLKVSFYQLNIHPEPSKSSNCSGAFVWISWMLLRQKSESS